MILRREDIQAFLSFLEEKKGVKVLESDFYEIKIFPTRLGSKEVRGKLFRQLYFLLKSISDQTGQDIETIKKAIKFVLFPEYESISFSHLSDTDLRKTINYLITLWKGEEI